MGEFDHANWQAALLAWFREHRHSWDVLALPELRVRVTATRFRVPDVTVLDRHSAREQVITLAPLAVFEILSPEDTVQRLKQRLDDYVSMGIAEIWVIDPQDSSFCRYEDRRLLRKQSFGYAPKASPLTWIKSRACSTDQTDQHCFDSIIWGWRALDLQAYPEGHGDDHANPSRGLSALFV